MTAKVQLSPQQQRDLVADYVAGIKVKDISERYGVSLPTVSYHVKKNGITRRIGCISSNTDSPRPIQGAAPAKCLKCGGEFIPYTYQWQEFRHLCFGCHQINRGYGMDTAFPIGRRN